jgi:hypothetical protein
MLLAAILGIYLLAPVTSLAAGTLLVREQVRSSPSGTAADSTAPQAQDSSTAPQEPEKSSVPSAQPAPATTPPQPSQGPSTTHKRRWHRKRSATTACPNSTAAAKGADAAGATDSQKPSGDCPPAKTVVRDGGTSEPTVQLKGSGSTGRGSHQGETAEQLLASTENKLKKAEEQKLSSNQLEMVNQIRQFMDQSKAAAAAGDLDRARNLALKANLLSDELVKPQP